MEFGVFDHLDRTGPSLADFYEDRLKIIEAYDRSGFYAYHLAEHHSTPLGMAPSPNIFLATIAQRTRRLRFGPLVYALPLHHPLRLLEEICMLDQLSRRPHGAWLRPRFGAGRDRILRRPIPPRRRRCTTEGLEFIIAGLTKPVLDFHGKFLHGQQRADGIKAVATAASADLVRRPCSRKRRARGKAQFACRRSRPAGGDADRHGTLSRDLAASASRRTNAEAWARPLRRRRRYRMPRRCGWRGAPIRSGIAPLPICLRS